MREQNTMQAKQDAKVPTKKLLFFWIDNKLFAVRATYIVEILDNIEVYPVPEPYDYVEGLVNLRGEIVTAINTRKRLSMPEKEEANTSILLFMEYSVNNKIEKLAFYIDSFLGVREVKQKDIKAVPDFGENIDPDFVQGVVKIEDDFAKVLNVSKLF